MLVLRKIRPLSVSRRWLSHSASVLSGKPDGVVKPWYEQEAHKAVEDEAIAHEAALPNLPPNSPESLKGIVDFGVKEMGLKDLAILDKRGEDGDSTLTSALGPAIVVVGTGNSTRHLGSAGALLISWLKKQHRVNAGRDGILSSNFVKLQTRRHKRKQQRQTMSSTTESSVQRVGSWVVVETKVDNIYVHMMTAERRNEVDLENLSSSIEREADLAEAEAESTEYADPNRSAGTTTGTPGKRQFSTFAVRRQSDLPTSREELALKTLLSDKNEELNETSRDVQDFVNEFPAVPTREDWKQRLRYFAVASIQSPQFSLQRVLREAELQQASGFVLDEEDVETVASAICYHGQSHFAGLSQDDESLALWQELCDYKAQLWVDLYDLALQPAGRSLVTNSRLLVLMYRTFVAPTARSVTPLGALETPEAVREDLSVFMDHGRAHPLRSMLQATGEIRNVQTVGMLLTSLANGKLYDAFWKVVDTATLTGSSRDFSEQVAELALSLIVKTGDVDQISFAIQTYLPNSILVRHVRLSTKLLQVIEHGLNRVDTGANAGFGPVRKLLAQARAPQLD